MSADDHRRARADLLAAALFLQEAGIDPFEVLRQGGAQDRALASSEAEVATLRARLERAEPEALESLLGRLEALVNPSTGETS